VKGCAGLRDHRYVLAIAETTVVGRSPRAGCCARDRSSGATRFVFRNDLRVHDRATLRMGSRHCGNPLDGTRRTARTSALHALQHPVARASCSRYAADCTHAASSFRILDLRARLRSTCSGTPARLRARQDARFVAPAVQTRPRAVASAAIATSGNSSSSPHLVQTASYSLTMRPQPGH
jgi:hypothetical protein